MADVRDRILYIVELNNGNWHTITRIKSEAECILTMWNDTHGGAKLIQVDVPEAED